MKQHHEILNGLPERTQTRTIPALFSAADLPSSPRAEGSTSPMRSDGAIANLHVRDDKHMEESTVSRKSPVSPPDSTAIIIPPDITDIDFATGLYPVISLFEGFAPEDVKFNWKSFVKGLPSAGWGGLVGTYFGGLQMKRSDVTAIKAALFSVGYVVNYLGAVLLFPRVIKLLKDIGVRRKDFPYLLFIFSGQGLSILSTIPIYALAQDASAELFISWPLAGIPNGDFKKGMKIIGDAGYIGNNAISRTWGAVNLLTLGWELSLMRRLQPNRYFLREVAGYLHKYKNAHPSGFSEINDEFLKRLFHNISVLRCAQAVSNDKKSWIPLLEKIATVLSLAMIVGSCALPPALLAFTQKGGSEISNNYPSDSWVLGWGSELATHMFYARAIYLLFGLLLTVLVMLFTEFKNLSILVKAPLLVVMTSAMLGVSFFSGEGWGVEARELEQLLQAMRFNATHNLTNNTNPYEAFRSVAADTYFPWASKLYELVAPHYGSFWATYAGAVNLIFLLTSVKDCLDNKNDYKISFSKAFLEKFFRPFGLEGKLPPEEKARKKNIEDANEGVHNVVNFNEARRLRDQAFKETSVQTEGCFLNKCWTAMFGKKVQVMPDDLNAGLLPARNAY